MKKYLIILTIVFIFLSCSNRKKHIEYFDKEETMKMFEGYTNREGHLDGPFVEYKENGNIRCKGNYINDSLDGEYFEYYPKDTTLKYHIEFHKNRLWNVKEYYDETHKALDFGDFKNGNGLLTIYFSDGRIYHKGNYRNGLKEGKWDNYAWGGSIYLSSDNYINGRKNGTASYDPNPFN